MQAYATEEERTAARRASRKRYKEEHKEEHAKAEKERYRKKPRQTGWTPKFVGVDGESFLTGKVIITEKDGKRQETKEQAYCLLYRHDLDYVLYDSQGLSTYECLQYLTEKKQENAAIVGFFLNFDFEWILKDLPQEDYLKLQRGEKATFCQFRLTWIPHKRLEIEKEFYGQFDVPEEDKKYYRACSIQDTQGFFQTSFVDALKKWGFKDDSRFDAIVKGKKARGGFEHADFTDISKYNEYELELLEELMMRVYEAFRDAYAAAGLEFRPRSDSWAGPGWFASDFLTQTDWMDEHPHVSDDLCDAFWTDHQTSLPGYMAEVHEYAKYLRDTEGMSRRYQIIEEVRKEGGIRIRQGSMWYAEWVETIPAGVRRRVTNQKGRYLDEVAQDLSMDAKELLQTLAEAQWTKPKVTDFYETAKDVLKMDVEISPNYPYPFSLAYFGGRIELAGEGTWENIINYDIRSAYPYALSLLPAWSEEDFRWMRVNPSNPDEMDDVIFDRPMGMYHIHFDFPAGSAWYPFPVRRKGNVFYPKSGATWVMSPEFFAVWDTLTEEEKSHIQIWDAFLIDGTSGYGDAMTRMPEERLSKTARMTGKLAAVRLELKNTGGYAERALKLILNSLYGKTIQQIGKHKHFQDFAAAWITSTCRALLWRAIASERNMENVLMTMTDGIYATKPLDFCESNLSEALGAFEREDFSWIETFKPGIYRYEDDKGLHYKVRGFLTPEESDRKQLFTLIDRVMYNGEKLHFPGRAFLTRNLCLEGYEREPLIRQFVTLDKDLEAELRAKRSPAAWGWTIPANQKHAFFYPKLADFPYSECYELQFQDIQPPPTENEEELQNYLEEVDAYHGLEDYAN